MQGQKQMDEPHLTQDHDCYCSSSHSSPTAMLVQLTGASCIDHMTCMPTCLHPLPAAAAPQVYSLPGLNLVCEQPLSGALGSTTLTWSPPAGSVHKVSRLVSGSRIGHVLLLAANQELLQLAVTQCEWEAGLSGCVSCPLKLLLQQSCSASVIKWAV
jgi:hypothetical protein